MKVSQDRARLSYLDILKGIGIVLVVIGHIYFNKPIVNWIYSFHMPLFFFAAGWVYKKKSIWIDFKKRIRTVIIPYFCFGGLTLIYWQLLERRFRDSDMSFVTAVYGLVFGQYDYIGFNVHLWFLPCFFIVVTLFNLLVHIGGRYGKQLAIIVSIIMSVVYILVPIPSLPWGVDRAFRFIVFYAIGTVLSSLNVDEKIKNCGKSVQYTVAAVLFSLNFAVTFLSLNLSIMSFVTAILGVISMLIISVTIEKNRILEYLGRISLVVLCVHGPVYRILIKMVSISLRLSTDAVRKNIVLTLFVTALTLCICMIAHQIIDRIVPWMIGKGWQSKAMSIDYRK